MTIVPGEGGRLSYPSTLPNQNTNVPLVPAPADPSSSTDTLTNQRNVPSTEAGPSTQPSPSNVSHFSLPPAYASRISLVPAEAPFEELAAADTTTKFAPPPDLGQTVADAVSTYLSGDEYLQKLRETVREEVEKEVEKLEKSTEKLERAPSEAPVPAPFAVPPTDISEFESFEAKTAASPFTYAIYCNSCENSIKDVHYHCGCCDRGDYDLCKSCVARGIHCKDSTHWLIKRVLSPSGVIVSSTTESVSQKDGSVKTPPRRTCNCCVVGELYLLIFGFSIALVTNSLLQTCLVRSSSRVKCAKTMMFAFPATLHSSMATTRAMSLYRLLQKPCFSHMRSIFLLPVGLTVITPFAMAVIRSVCPSICLLERLLINS